MSYHVEMMRKLQEEVAKQTTVIDSVVSLISGLRGQLQSAKQAILERNEEEVDLSDLQGIIDGLHEHTGALSQASLDNTAEKAATAQPSASDPSPATSVAAGASDPTPAQPSATGATASGDTSPAPGVIAQVPADHDSAVQNGKA